MRAKHYIRRLVLETLKHSSYIVSGSKSPSRLIVINGGCKSIKFVMEILSLVRLYA